MAGFEVNKENCIEFISGEHYCTISFTNRKHINRIKSLHEKHKDEFKYFHENKDGSICAKFPLKWMKISFPRQVSEEQRLAASERFQKMHHKNKQ